MENNLHDVKPRRPKEAKLSLELIERYVKLAAQCVAIAVPIAGLIVGIAKYGSSVLHYVTVAYKAVQTANAHERDSVAAQTYADVTLTYVYTVRKGDQLLDLCLHHKMSLNQVMDLNPHIIDPDRIEANKTRLRLRAQCHHNVGPGDILRVVADKYHVTLKELMRANYKTRNYVLRGEKLVIPYHVKP